MQQKPRRLTKGDSLSKSDLASASLIAYTKYGRPTGHFRCPLNPSTWIRKTGSKMHPQNTELFLVDINAYLSRSGGPVYIYKKPPSAGVYAKVSMSDIDRKKILRRRKRLNSVTDKASVLYAVVMIIAGAGYALTHIRDDFYITNGAVLVSLGILLLTVLHTYPDFIELYRMGIRKQKRLTISMYAGTLLAVVSLIADIVCIAKIPVHTTQYLSVSVFCMFITTVALILIVPSYNISRRLADGD